VRRIHYEVFRVLNFDELTANCAHRQDKQGHRFVRRSIGFVVTDVIKLRPFVCCRLGVLALEIGAGAITLNHPLDQMQPLYSGSPSHLRRCGTRVIESCIQAFVIIIIGCVCCLAIWS
jgi:hypothetical protein